MVNPDVALNAVMVLFENTTNTALLPEAEAELNVVDGKERRQPIVPRPGAIPVVLMSWASAMTMITARKAEITWGARIIDLIGENNETNMHGATR